MDKQSIRYILAIYTPKNETTFKAGDKVMYIPTKADNADKAERGKCYAIGSPVELKYRAVAVDKTVKPATKKVKAQTLAVQPVAQPAPVIASGIMSEPSRRPLKMYRRQGRLFIAGDDTMLNQIATVIARHSS